MSVPNHLPESLFVERVETHDALEDALKRPGLLIVGDMKGAPGLGKTTVLSQFYYHLRRENPTLPLSWVDLREFSDAGRTSDDMQGLRSALELYRRLLISLDRNLVATRDEHAREVRYVPRLGKRHPLRVFSRFHFHEIAITPSPPFVSIKWIYEKEPEELTVSAIEQARRKLTQTLARRIKRLAKNCVPVLFFDNFCQIEGSLLEKWILQELLPAIPGCRAVLARSDYEHPLPVACPTSPIPIKNFDAAESRTYVERTLGQEALEQGWDTLIFEYCQGHPLSTALLVEIIRERGLQRQSARAQLHELLTSVQQSTSDKIERLNRDLIDLIRQRDPDLAEAIDVACILHDFDLGILTFVLRDNISADEAENLWEKLRRLPISKHYVTAENEGRIAFHELFAHMREAWLRRERGDLVDRYHRDAAAYYRQMMKSAEEESTEGVWGRMHRFEDTRWQSWNRHWLRHLAASSNSPQVGLELATRFFDAFFWWGEYVPFPFCRTLLEDIENLDLPESHVVRRWLAPLREFLEAFPPVRGRTAGGEWGPPARAVLRRIWERACLDNIDEHDAPRWHLRGVLLNYMGDAWAAESVTDPRTWKFYQDSIEAFEKAAQIYREHLQEPLNASARRYFTEQSANESWYDVWMQIWLAGIYAQAGHYDLALRVCERAEQKMRSIAPDDIEALARLCRTRGDAYFGKANREKAIRAYCLYALHALGFLVDSYTDRCDPYTIEFFRETIEHIARRMVALQEMDPQAVAGWWSQFRSFWLPEGEIFLPAGSSDPPEDVGTAIRWNDRGQILSHSLPLPELPPWLLEWEKMGGSISLSRDWKSRLQNTYQLLLERHACST